VNILYKKFQPNSFEACYEVHMPQDGMRLDQYLQIFFPSFSREQIKEKIKDGDVEIVGRPGRMKPNTKVYEKEKVITFVHKTIHEDEWWDGEKLELESKPPIVYEDDGLYVLSKPPFMSTHPTGKHLFYCATVYLESLAGRGTHSVHRLDRETSGVLLVAKNPEAANKYTVYFEKEQVRKCYFFIGVKNESYSGTKQFTANERLDTGGEGLLRVLIGHHPEDSSIGKRAETGFDILYEEGKYVLGLAFPKTGRQHQIRVHAMAHGFPLLGDKLYYGSYKMFQSFKDRYAKPEDYAFMQLPRHALHATAINIPWDSDQMDRRTFFGPPPEDMGKWIRENLSLDYDLFLENTKKTVENYFSRSDK
jgi:RluA family pseudouridine synthase